MWATDGRVRAWPVDADEPVGEQAGLLAVVGDADRVAATLEPYGWQFVDPDLDERRWRRFFVQVTAGRRSAHLHLMASGSPRWDQQLRFRDALRADPTRVAAYTALKRDLAAQHVDDREAYTDAKSDFIRSVLDRERSSAEG